MRTKTGIVKFILILIFLEVTFSDFLTERLAVIDSKGQNYLVRGNLPIKNLKFQMKELKEGLSQLTELKEFNLVVYSLLNFLTPKQTRNRYIEEKYFDSHPKDGKYTSKLILGSLINPSSIPKWLRRAVATAYDFLGVDDMNDFVDQLNSIITKSRIPTIVYVHCSAGVDRTGYVSASYRMKFNKMSFEEVIQENLKVLVELKRHMHFNTYNGLKWFCLTLNRSEQECQIHKEAQDKL